MKQLTGFLISRHWHDHQVNGRPKLVLTFWFATDNGIIKAVFDNQRSVFFIPANELRRATELLAEHSQLPDCEVKPLNLKSFKNHPVYAFYFSNQRSFYNARALLRKHTIYPMEADILPTDRYLMERFITGGAKIYGKFTKKGKYLEVTNPRLEPANFKPEFSVLSLDIETSLTGNELYSIGLIHSHTTSPETVRKEVLMVGDSRDESEPNHGRPDYLKLFANEKLLFEYFLNRYKQLDPDIIIGWNVINFDLRFLQKKAEQFKVPFTIGRDETIPEWRESRGESEHFTLTLPGRLVLDGIDTLRSATFNFESFSLNYVANQVLDRGKLIEHNDSRGEEITRLFHFDKQSLAAYNLEDCQLVWDIFQRTQLIDFAIERAQLTGLAMDRFGGSVASFDNRYLPRLHRKGYVAPNIPLVTENIGSPGGYVMDSLPGIYDHVLVLDFKSLYPSIIRTFKIDPYGLVEGLNQEQYSAIKNQAETRVDNKKLLVPGFNGAVFHKQHNILPDLIAELWQSRDRAKQDKNSALSQAIKILMNSFYGVLGTPGCRFFDFRLPSSITLRGHQILYTTKEFIEQQGYKVIYGDTDSVFVWLKGFHRNIAPETIREIGHELAEKLNQWWQQKLHEEYQIESHLELEFETHFKRFVMPTIRGSDKGSKKRYAGLKVTEKREEKLIFKGLENVRTDWTKAAREFQMELYRRIFYDEPYHEFIRETVANIYQGHLDNKLIYRKRLRRHIEDYQKNIPPHVQAARLQEQKLAANNLPTQLKRGSWVEYVLTTSGPQPVDFISSPLDYDLYVMRQIKPIADGILHFLGESFEQICNRQIQLL